MYEEKVGKDDLLKNWNILGIKMCQTICGSTFEWEQECDVLKHKNVSIAGQMNIKSDYRKVYLHRMKTIQISYHKYLSC